MATEYRFVASESAGEVSALLDRDGDSNRLLVLGHGAGAGMRHVFMQDLAGALLSQGVATLRYQFPYIENGRKRPDHQPVLLQTVQSACEFARGVGDGLPMFLGGKSMGGRMASNRMAKEAIPGVEGLVFFGFPLHPSDKPGTQRADHLTDVHVPMLFLQGTRDKLAYLDLLTPICERLETATLHVIEAADHGFHVLKRSGRTDAEVLEELATTAGLWMSRSR